MECVLCVSVPWKLKVDEWRAVPSTSLRRVLLSILSKTFRRPRRRVWEDAGIDAVVKCSVRVIVLKKFSNSFTLLCWRENYVVGCFTRLHTQHSPFFLLYLFLPPLYRNWFDEKKNMKTLPIGFKCRCAVVPFVSEHLHRCSRYSCQSADANVFSRGPNLPYVLPKDMLYTPCKIQLFPLQNEGLAVCANLSSTVLCERSHKGLIDWAVSVQSIQVSSGANA